jgi:hypothetical protein
VVSQRDSFRECSRYLLLLNMVAWHTASRASTLPQWAQEDDVFVFGANPCGSGLARDEAIKTRRQFNVAPWSSAQ